MTPVSELSRPPRFTCLDDWLRWQERLHPAEIELGLERVRQVWQALGTPPREAFVITVGGTNGKGSSVSMLEAIYADAGYRVGAYTSPHLLHYNERIRIAGAEVDDVALCNAFAAVDEARGDVSLTYFEFGTLAALHLFADSAVDVVLLEVGLGGRLDAVNVVDSDIALVTTVGLDHQDWLGPDRESIGYEKAGIYRGGRPAVCADPEPPQSLLRHAAGVAAQLLVAGSDFGWRHESPAWVWHGSDGTEISLPLPAMAGDAQLANAAGVLQVVQCAQSRVPVPNDALASGLARAVLPGRCQVLPGPVERIFDVAHNADSVRALVEALATRPVTGRRRTVLGMLRDKPAAEVIVALAPHTDCWYLASLPGNRGLEAEVLGQQVRSLVPGATIETFAGAGEATARALDVATAGDRVVVTGSFLTVAAAMAVEAGGSA